MPPARGAGEVGVELVLALRALPIELRAKVRPALTEAARPILADARARASWSSRIPGSLVTRIGFGQDTASVRLVARRSAASHARAFEGLQRGARSGLFRHPVFGHRDRFVSQPTRPFLGPAVEAGRDDVLDRLTDALTSSAAAAGWRS